MNLIICTTPFQVLLAEKIITMHLNSNEEYIFRYISSIKNEKHLYYFNRLRLDFNIKDSQFIHIECNSKLGILVSFLKMKLYSYFLSDRIARIILGSVDNSYIHVYLHSILKSRSGNLTVHTFDDGTANIDKNSFIFKEKISRKIKFICFFLCRGTNLFSLKDKSKKHYTIYKKQCNLVENKDVEYLELCPYSNVNAINIQLDVESVDTVKLYRIFLGQPIYNLDISGSYTAEMHYTLLANILDKCKIQYYFPHPKEILEMKFKNTEVIDTCKIFEDYFFENYRLDVKYIIYTFFSGSVLSVVNLPNVNVVLFRVKDFPVDVDVYNQILSLGFDISTVDVLSNNLEEIYECG